MGDISRHRDIFLNTRDAIPAGLLASCKLTKSDLTYLELGNYFTDVSQFRDPVFYIFSKRRVWREFILPRVEDKVDSARGLTILAGIAGYAAAEIMKGLTSGTVSSVAKYAGPSLAGVGAAIFGALSLLSTDTIAGLKGADDWLDKMLGTPVEKIVTKDLTKREQEHYGYVGQFFRHFIEGITHLLFASDVVNKVPGDWSKIERIPSSSVTEVFKDFFTQYYPHEHTDQPPYIWDASERTKHPDLYGPSTHQQNLVDKDIGVMNAVDKHYVQYLSEGLSDLEQDWRNIKDADIAARHRWLLRMGKLLHAVEDWYFHSNVVELIRLRGHKKAQQPGEDREAFLKRFVEEVGQDDPEFKDGLARGGEAEWVRLQRRLFRRLRFPAYERGPKEQSGGILSKKVMSSLSLHFAYPAFPSQQDTTHTLLHALENLEVKTFRSSDGHGDGSSGILEKLPWAFCVIGKMTAEKDGEGDKLFEERVRERGTTKATVLASRRLPPGPDRDKANAVITDLMREWLPLVATLLIENERQRLVANVPPDQWRIGTPTRAQLKSGPPGDREITDQLERHKRALQRKLNEDGRTESNYERTARYLVECDFLNAAGQAALVKAFENDQKSQELLDDAPGAGGFLMNFALDLQKQLDIGEEKTEELNKDKKSIFNPVSDNDAFHENIGSHSLMSKDTKASGPFFNDATVLASVASQSVFHVMLEQISAPSAGRRLPWKALLHELIRYPPTAGGWERQALALFQSGNIPKYADIPELARVVQAALRSNEALALYRKGTKDDELKKEYVKLEMEVSHYRFP